MSAQPQWESVDNYTTDLLALVAQGTPATPTADEEWADYLIALKVCATTENGNIRPNALRPLVRGRVAPKRIGAFVSRAVAQKLIAPTGDFEISDDREGRNAGRPMRTYSWIGGEVA